MTRDLWFGTSGPQTARIAIVGESWGENEAVVRKPFVGNSGEQFTKMLREAGIDRASCFMTNVISERPENNEAWRFFEKAREASGPAINHLYPSEFARAEIDRLYRQLDAINPDLIIAVGNYALWALTPHIKLRDTGKPPIAKEKRTGRSTGIYEPAGIMSYRGSMLYRLKHRLHAPNDELCKTKVLPIIHPAAILQNWELRAPTIHDLRVRTQLALADDWRPDPEPTILAPASYEDTVGLLHVYLNDLEYAETLISADVETLPQQSLLVCLGLCRGNDFAISIPFLFIDGDKIASYWSPEQEAEIIDLCRKILSHPNARIIGQNFIYDMQWILRDWGIEPALHFDTMLAHHLCFPGTPKALDYLSSLYCKYHWYWKDDSKEWHQRTEGFQELLRYNCIDVLRTYEIATELKQVIEKFDMATLWQVELEKHALALRMMRRGISIDKPLRRTYTFQIMEQAEELQAWIEDLFPSSIFGTGKTTKTPWYQSPKQTMIMFYEIMGLKSIYHRKTRQLTTGKEAMEELETRYPRLGKLFRNIRALRSLGVFQTHFMQAPLDPDGRMRCSFNPAGTESLRWSSSENAFGRGTNLQNLPTGNVDD